MALLDKIKQKYLPQENRFYRKYYSLVIIVLMVFIVILIASVYIVFYQMKHRPLPTFKALSPNKKQLELTAFDEPNLLPDTIIRWANKAATAAYTFDFVNYISQVNAVRPYFTEAGWQDYLGSVNDLINTIVANKLFVNGVVAGTSVISNQGSIPGTGYLWRVQIPFLVTYQSANVPSQRNFYVVLTIVRIPTYINPQGIGIDQFVMVNRS